MHLQVHLQTAPNAHINTKTYFRSHPNKLTAIISAMEYIYIIPTRFLNSRISREILQKLQQQEIRSNAVRNRMLYKVLFILWFIFEARIQLSFKKDKIKTIILFFSKHTYPTDQDGIHIANNDIYFFFFFLLSVRVCAYALHRSSCIFLS